MHVAAALPSEAHSRTSTMDEIVALFRARTGIELEAYRGGMIERRIRNRMIALGALDEGRYLQRLRADPLEAARLLDRIAIKVSRFYRNAPAFDALRERLLPELARTRGRPLRVRSVGCGRGEEAWTLAMLLDEAGVDGTVDASDLDPGAIAAARTATYPESALVELPGALRERYLEPLPGAIAGRFRISARLAPRVRFLREDVLGTTGLPTFATYDLVACRNVLIYFLPPAQERALARLCDWLLPGGLLFLGESEWPTAAVTMRRVSPLRVRDRLFVAADGDACRGTG